MVAGWLIDDHFDEINMVADKFLVPRRFQGVLQVRQGRLAFRECPRQGDSVAGSRGWLIVEGDHSVPVDL